MFDLLLAYTEFFGCGLIVYVGAVQKRVGRGS
jgi:hypothetical protein